VQESNIRKCFLAIDGSARALLQARSRLLHEIAKDRHKVVACAALDRSMSDIQIGDIEILRKRYRQLDIEFVKLDMSRQGINPFEDLMTLLELAKLVRKLRPDIVLNYSVKPNIYGSVAAKLAGIPEIYSVVTGLGYLFSNDSGFKTLIPGIGRTMLRIALSTNKRVFFQNADDRAEFVSKGLIDPDQTVIINGSGVDLSYYSVEPFPDGPLVFLLIARLQHHKGILEYIQAAHTLKKLFPQARFQLIGPFDQHPSALKKTEIEVWRKQGDIEFLGGTADVRPFIAKAHVFVLPSYREGTPRSTLEAMAMGRPVITTDVPGCRDTVLHRQNGLIVPAGDSIALTDAMREFLESPSLIVPMGRCSRNIAEEKYDVSKVVAVMRDAMNI